MARIFKRSFGIIAFNAGQTVSLDLPRNHVFKSVYLRLTGTLGITVGTAGPFNSEQPMSLIRSVALVRNGSDVLQRADGGSLWQAARYNSDGDPQVTPVSALTVASYPFSADIPIDLAAWRMSNPSQTLLRAVGTSSLRLDVTWGQTTDICALGAATLAITNCQVEVFTEEIMDLTGDFGDKLVVVTSRPVTVATNQFTVDLPVGPFYRRLIFKSTHTPAGAGATSVLTDAMINRVRIISDGSFFHTDRMSWNALQGMNKRNYAIGNIHPLNSASNVLSVLQGYGVVDFAEDGNVGGLIDTRGSSSFQAELDVNFGTGGLTGAQQIQIIQEQIVPARVAAAA